MRDDESFWHRYLAVNSALAVGGLVLWMLVEQNWLGFILFGLLEAGLIAAAVQASKS